MMIQVIKYIGKEENVLEKIIRTLIWKFLHTVVLACKRDQMLFTHINLRFSWLYHSMKHLVPQPLLPVFPTVEGNVLNH